jgi:hypothetical protein
MKAKIKKLNSDGIVRLETSGDIKEVRINEDFLHPKDESIALCFRGKNSSGIIELNVKEFQELAQRVEKSLHLLGEVKIIK